MHRCNIQHQNWNRHQKEDNNRRSRGWRIHSFMSLPKTTTTGTEKARTFLIVMDLIMVTRSSRRSRNRNVETMGAWPKTTRGEQRPHLTNTKHSHQQSFRLCRRKGCPADRTRPRWLGWRKGYRGGRRWWRFWGNSGSICTWKYQKNAQNLTLIVPEWDLLKRVCSVSQCARGFGSKVDLSCD